MVISQSLDTLLIQGESKDQQKHGEWISYFPNGKIQSICNFNHGTPHGSIIVYEKSGLVLYRGNFINGLKVGEWVFYDRKSGKKVIKDY